jgi:hypothetical protein
MNLKQAKDRVAQSWGLPDYNALVKQGRPDLSGFMEQVAKLYAKSKWDEACDETKEILKKKLLTPFNISMINAIPRPKFKP